MNHIVFLDRVLVWLNNRESYLITKDHHSEFTDEENKYLPAAARKLHKDGYADPINAPQRSEFKISFEGKVALENAPEKFKNKPYQYKLHKEILAKRKELIKDAAIAANAIISLILSAAAVVVAYLTFKHPI